MASCTPPGGRSPRFFQEATDGTAADGTAADGTAADGTTVRTITLPVTRVPRWWRRCAVEEERKARAEAEAALGAAGKELEGARAALEREQEAHATLRTGMSRSREEMERDVARLKAELEAARCARPVIRPPWALAVFCCSPTLAARHARPAH